VSPGSTPRTAATRVLCSHHERECKCRADRLRTSANRSLEPLAPWAGVPLERTTGFEPATLTLATCQEDDPDQPQ
jgi:hypothetical protein